MSRYHRIAKRIASDDRCPTCGKPKPIEPRNHEAPDMVCNCVPCPVCGGPDIQMSEHACQNCGG